MTAVGPLAAMLPLVDDLARDLPESERYRRLLAALRELIPCDATALLRLDGEHLTPLAVDGLGADTLGRRFRMAEHPRLAAILTRRGPTRFDSDCGLPDPYDGLIEGQGDQLEIHDCLGCPLFIDDQPWGLLTLDVLGTARFKRRQCDLLEAFARLAAASVKAAERIRGLAGQLEEERLRAESYQQAASHGQSRELIGQSPALKALRAEILLLGSSDLNVLITGETGVGKELVAQAIHGHSARADKPLVSLNCAALPESLIESELFGHVRGAFSGAVSERRGKFELADGGCLFLDEVGELPLASQAKLLRVLQGGQLQRLGSDREHRVDVRVIAASNRDLAEEVRRGRLRADLYHRLSVYPLRVPALRERGRDVLLLAGGFLEENRPRLGLRGLRLGADAQAALLGYQWPGNVRELEHLIGRAALKALGGRPGARPGILTLHADDLGLPPVLPQKIRESKVESAPPGPVDLRQAVTDFQREQIAASLLRQQGNWSATAQELGLDRANLNRLARRLGLK